MLLGQAIFSMEHNAVADLIAAAHPSWTGISFCCFLSSHRGGVILCLVAAVGAAVADTAFLLCVPSLDRTVTGYETV